MSASLASETGKCEVTVTAVFPCPLISWKRSRYSPGLPFCTGFHALSITLGALILRKLSSKRQDVPTEPNAGLVSQSPHSGTATDSPKRFPRIGSKPPR